MDKAGVWLRRLLYEVRTHLLGHNELLDRGRLVLGTHFFRLCSSTDSVVSKLSELDQTWVELQCLLQRNTCTDPFICCEVEQELRCKESEDHPSHLEKISMGDGVMSDGYVEVRSTPYTYN